MSDRMPIPDPILPIAMVALLASGISMFGFKLLSSVSSKIRNAHTHFALGQMAEIVEEVGNADYPRTKIELLAVLRSSAIDWNSCGIEGSEIYDGWGQAITTTFDESGGIWTFRSPGKDRKIGTDDDIEKRTERTQSGEQESGGHAPKGDG